MSSAANSTSQHENVNGSLIILDIQRSSPAPDRQQRRFTVRFGSPRPADSVVPSRIWLASAVAINVLAVAYLQPSLTTLLLTASGFAVLTIMWLTHSIQYESMLVTPGVGIQCSTQYVQGRQEQFIPWSSVEDVVINEIVHLNRVLHHLTILTQESEETKIITLFKYTKPRLLVLETIYTEIQMLLRSRQEDTNKSGSGDVSC